MSMEVYFKSSDGFCVCKSRVVMGDYSWNEFREHVATEGNRLQYPARFFFSCKNSIRAVKQWKYFNQTIKLIERNAFVTLDNVFKLRFNCI